MNEFEIIRAMIAVGMMSVATHYDVKTRYVDDRVWVFGLSAFAAVSSVFIFGFGTSVQELISPLNIIGMMSGMGIAFTGWVMKFAGMGYATGDLFGLLTLFVILPSFSGIAIPIIVIMISCLFSVIIMLGTNLRINIKSKNLFSEFDEPAYKKALAYFIMHKKIENEKFAFPAEIMAGGKRKFQFRHEPDSQEFITEVKSGYVCSTTPMMLSVLVGLGFAIIAAITL
ncbi:MAG: hypothetical protein EPO62_01160 [Candidatus Nitrosotenuis sp.]|nr:MAG: hypothetical protein EPO62_01160 [Candidatus Nitrosotenuis sp.]